MSSHRWFFILFAGFGWALSFNILAAGECEPWVARIVSVEGQVEAKPAGKTHWQAVQSDATLCADDSLRVGALSRAAIEFNQDTNLLRLEQNTVVTLSETQAETPSWIELLQGAVYFISRVPHALNIKTKFLNANVEGTEFMVRVEHDRSTLWVLEGRILASNEIGSLSVPSGEAAIARAGEAPMRHLVARPRDAVQWALYYPPLIDYRGIAYWTGLTSRTVAHALVRFRAGDLSGTFAGLDNVPAGRRDERYFTLRAGLLLSVGRVDEARTDIAKALNLDSNNATAVALQSVIAVVQNEEEKALSLAKQSVELDPQSPVPRIALSYAYQANFEIEKARASVQEAVNLAPADALAWARLAELWLSMGHLDRALDAAQEAVVRNPDLARTQTVLGYSHLTRFEIDKARSAFEKATRLDQSDPLPRLGLGLAKVRKNDLEGGRREIEIAASLDPNNSLIRSYLGKAYFEETRDSLAATEFIIAQGLDPHDPTPWYYDAIRKQLDNRPVEALHDIEQAIELNDNRAVYRSRLLLDQDLAARGVSQARIYNDLGFDQLALVEGTKSLSIDPANHSAHRFLSDTYARLPRHEIARVSELLQAQLLQPININPVQPRLTATDLNIVSGIGPAEAAFNEFTPLFVRDNVQLTGSGIIGNNDTLGDEIVVSGIRNRYSYSLGQFHFESDGFRKNNDIQHDIYNIFTHVALTDKFDVQFEYRQRETDQGDRWLNFDPDEFSRTDRRRIEQDVARFGLHLASSPQSDTIVSLIYSDRTGEVKSKLSPDFMVSELTDLESYDVQGQYLFRGKQFSLTAGAGIHEIDVDSVILQTFLGSEFDPFETRSTIEGDNVYVYTNISIPESLIWTFGLSYDSFDDESLDLAPSEVNPKFGLQWNITDRIRLRTAALSTLKRQLTVDQTLEPTQVAGFNQFFDDVNGATAEIYGMGLDTTLNESLYSGVEFLRRDLEVPLFSGGSSVFKDREEDIYQAYLYWTPHPNWILSAEYRLENIEGDPETITKNVETIDMPLTIKYFSSKGVFAELVSTYVRQKVDLPTQAGSFNQTSEDFLIVDTAVGYRLPNRWGIVSLEIGNLFDKEFRFQDLNFLVSDPTSTNPRFIPDRTILGRLTLTF